MIILLLGGSCFAGGGWTVRVPAPFQSHSPYFRGCQSDTAHPSQHSCCLAPCELLLGDPGLRAGLESEYPLLTALRGLYDELLNMPTAMMLGRSGHQVSHRGRVLGQGCPSCSSPISPICVGGESSTPGVRAWLDSPLVVGVAVAKPQDLCGCSCGVLGAGSSNPLEQRALNALALFATRSCSSFSSCSLFGA